MSRRLATIVVSAALLAGCGTGLHAGTYQSIGRQDGASADLDKVLVRNLHVVAPDTDTIPAGGELVLNGGLVNQGAAEDRLRSVTSEIATEVRLTLDGQDVTGIPLAPGTAAGKWTAVLTGLTREVRSGEYIPVTLTFASSGRTTVDVPVRTGDNGLVGREVRQNPYGEAEHGEGG